MSHQATFWQRVGAMFHGSLGSQNHRNGDGHEPRAESDDALLVEIPKEVPAHDGQTPGFLARLGRREPSVAHMRDGYHRMLETMDALQEHFHRQDERAAQLGQHVDRMVGYLEQLATTSSSQQDHIRSIAENVSQAGRHTAAMSDSLSQMPPLLQAEAEAVRALVRQMDVAQESDTQLMHSLQKLSQAVDSLNAAGAAQTQTLERLSAAEREQKEALTTLVREQARRFFVIIAIAAILGLGALAALVTVLGLQLNQ